MCLCFGIKQNGVTSVLESQIYRQAKIAYNLEP